MKITIRPWSGSDRGGYICMPLRQNVPQGRPEWRLTRCPECGRECWADDKLQQLPLSQGATALCTECALRKGQQA